MLFETEINNQEVYRFVTVTQERTNISYGRIIGEDETHIKVVTEYPDNYPNQTITYLKTVVKVIPIEQTNK